MLLIEELELNDPWTLPDGTIVKKFTRSADVEIRRVPPFGNPARLVITGPWGTVERDWEGSFRSMRHSQIPGPNPHTVVPKTTAAEFIDYLNAEHADRLIYRGTKCETFKLIPNALRKPAATTKEQVAREAKDLVRFYDATYEQGLTIPSWPAVSATIEELRRGAYRGPANWPPHHLHEFIALAQHHGLETRVLDWTRDPMVAAYFAARPAPPTPSGFVAVWIFDQTAYDDVPSLSGNRVSSFITVPYDVNPNARAQHGVFTLHEPPSEFDSSKPPGCQSLDLFLSTRSLVDPPNGLRKVTLPRTEEAALLKLLHRRRINGSTMFPGYYGAKTAADERATWDP